MHHSWISPRLAAALLGAAALVVLVYWPGLSGGFLLDDFENFSPLTRFVAGELTWQGAVFSNQSGPLGRPLSMASFAADAHVFGLDSRVFLRTNLAIHLGSALLVFLLLRRLLALTPQLAPAKVAWIALGLAFVWAVLPIHVSVVLYAVQRMALLSALFVFAALLVFVIARQRLRDGRSGWALPLFVGFPLLTAMAVLSKENGALAPLIAGAIELAWFREARNVQERRVRSVFFGLFLGLPAVLALAALVLAPERFLGGYEIRTFTLAERLLTQPRVLWDYVQHIVLPFGPAMGLIHDDYPKSTTLLSPPATVVAIVAWIAALVLAWRLRSTAPAVLGGLLVFLTAHAMESTIFPLELYFEHRNYVAAVGVVIAVAGLVAAGHARLGATTPAFRRVLAATVVALPLAFATASFARAMVWGDPQARMTQALATSPYSPRLRAQLAIEAAESGDLPGAMAQIQLAAAGPSRPPPRTLDLWRVVAACVAGATLEPDPVVERLLATEHPAISMSEMAVFEALAKRIEAGECPWPTAAQAQAIGETMLAQSRQAPGQHQIWRTRYMVARLQATQGLYADAVATAEVAWRDSRWTAGVGILVFQLHASLGNLAACRATVERLRSNAGRSDLALITAIEKFDAFLADPGKAADIPPAAPVP
jgi:hypothetical protein